MIASARPGRSPSALTLFGAAIIVAGLLCSIIAGADAFAASRLSLAPKAILPPEQPQQVGRELTVSAGQVVLRAKLGWFAGARLEGPASVEVAGKAVTLASGSLLIGAIPEGGTASALGRNPIFCTGSEREAVLGIAAPVAVSRLCFVDADRDGRFEQAVQPGAKQPESRPPFAIAPVPYKMLAGVPMSGESEVRIVYQSGSTFRIEVVEGGEVQKFGLFAARLGPSTIMQSSKRFKVQQKHLPQRQLVGSAIYTVLSVDEQANQARVRIDRDFYLAPYTLGQGPQTIYIYVP